MCVYSIVLEETGIEQGAYGCMLCRMGITPAGTECNVERYS